MEECYSREVNCSVDVMHPMLHDTWKLVASFSAASACLLPTMLPRSIRYNRSIREPSLNMFRIVVLTMVAVSVASWWFLIVAVPYDSPHPNYSTPGDQNLYVRDLRCQVSQVRICSGPEFLPITTCVSNSPQFRQPHECDGDVVPLAPDREGPKVRRSYSIPMQHSPG
jgi:hypothetical protein